MTVTITVRGVLCSRDTLTRHSLVLLDSMQAFVTSWKGIKNDSGGGEDVGNMGRKMAVRNSSGSLLEVCRIKKNAKRREMTRKDRWAKDKGIGTEGNER